MKETLRFIAECQEKYITKIWQKKEATNLGEVAGVNLGGDLNVSQYNDILSNISGYLKDAKRFKKDSSKIVLEKNSTLLALQDNDLFFFRKLSNKGGTSIITNKSFGEKVLSEVMGLIPLFIIIYIVVIAIMFFGGKDDECSPPSMTTVMIVCPILLLWAIFWSVKVIKYKKWLKNDSNKRELIFRRDKNADNNMEISVDIAIQMPSENLTFAGKNSKEWYDKAIREVTILSAKFNGRIGWLWNYKKQIEVNDDYHFRIEGRGPHDEISITNNTDNLLCFIETQHSFIFHFPPDYFGHGGFETEMSHEVKKGIENLFEAQKEKMFLSYD